MRYWKGDLSLICLFILLICAFQDDDEGHLTAFHCVEDLMSKGEDTFLVQFVRLGVLNRIKDINDSYEKEDNDKSDQNTGAVRLECFIQFFPHLLLTILFPMVLSITL